jgi:type IV pilus assembly protein PilQ
MKGNILIPLLTALLIAPLSAQDAQMASLDRAKETIAETDATYQANEAEVLDAVEEPDLPEEPVFEVPSDEVFLDLPGGDDASTVVAGDSETISVDFPEEDVRDIIRSVAELYELNVVIPDSLAGSVSIKLRDVTWTQVFDVVLEPMNYTYIVEGNIVKIKSQDELAVEPVDTRVFIVDFAKASEIRGSIEPLVDAASGGKIQVDVRSNALVITERPSRMNDIQEIIETLDRPTEQVMIESKFIEVMDGEEENLGINWESLNGWGLQAEAPTRVYTRSRGYTTETEVVNDLITQTPSGTFVYEEPINEVERFDSAVFSTDAFRAVLSALETSSEIELVSNPTVVTMNNSPATINIGEEYPIPSYTYNDERGTFEVSNFEYKNIGINMEVTPQINSAGFINLNIKPEISSRQGTVQFGGASGAAIPIISTRKTVSTVSIKSGYTLAIGGLIEQKTDNSDTSVPVLGSIPYLGRLFSSESKTTERQNLIVFITAKILSASGATYEDVYSDGKLLEMGISPTDVPGYEPSQREQDLYKQVLDSRENVENLKKELELRQELMLLDSVKQGNEVDLQEQGMEEEGAGSYPKRNFKG